MSFKIYQIHECGGQWEDSYDFIRSSYLSKEKAEAEMERMKKEEKYLLDWSLRCHECPLRIHSEESVDMSKYCDKYEPFDESKHDLDEYDGDEKCVNEYWNHEDSWFKIEEVEVIE